MAGDSKPRKPRAKPTFLRIGVLQAILFRNPAQDGSQVGQNLGRVPFEGSLLLLPAIEGFPLPAALFKFVP